MTKWTYWIILQKKIDNFIIIIASIYGELFYIPDTVEVNLHSINYANNQKCIIISIHIISITEENWGLCVVLFVS